MKSSHKSNVQMYVTKRTTMAVSCVFVLVSFHHANKATASQTNESLEEIDIHSILLSLYFTFNQSIVLTRAGTCLCTCIVQFTLSK